MAGKGMGLGRTHGNGTSHAADHHLSRGAVAELDDSMEQAEASLTPTKVALKALSADMELLCKSVAQGNFDSRADVTKHLGEHREIAQAMNQTLDLVVDKLNLYKTIVDSVPFPIQVIDKDMNWVFLNKAFEKLMVDATFIKSRRDAPGRPCSTAGAAICKTQNCGIVQLNKGVGESYFDWHGQSCKQDTSRLVNAKGEHVGYIEVVQDLTSIVRSKDYTASEVDRLAGNLTKLAQGDFDLDLEVKQADQHTNEAQQHFVKINESLRAVKSAVEAMALDAELLTKAAAEGELSIRADASKHQGEFRNIVEGINLAFETIAAPLVRAIEHLDKLSRGINGEQITRTYKGELQRLTEAFNKVFVSINALVADSTMLAQAGAEGKLSTRADASRHQGDFRKIVQGVNDTLDAVIGPLKFSAGYVDRISKGDIPEKITDNYNGDFNEIKINLNRCIDAVNAMIGDAVMLSSAAVDGKLSTRADASRHQGDFRKIVEGVNDTLDAVIGPLKFSAGYVDRISKGDIPEKITDNYNGDFNEIKINLNQCIDAVNAMIGDAVMLSKAAVDGKLSTRADASKHQGDFRKIVQGVNSTLDAVVEPMQDVGAVLIKLAGGDFTAEVTNKYAGDYEHLTGAVNTLSQSVRSALGQIGRNVASIAASAEELNKVSQSMGSNADETATQASVVAAAADQVSKNVQTVATGADEMGASIREIAKSTAEATRVASSAVRTAESTNETISKLGQSSAEIGQVIKVITSIAQQTNLLALNATIEAARAGEAGKGFAVVANEVKELAKETAKATEDISQKIAAIQTDTSGAVSAIGQISQVIGQISDIQNTIASAIEEQSATTNEIGRTLAEAAKGSTDITKNIGGVAEAAHSTTVGATETLKSAHTLEKMAAELQTLVGQFRY